MRTEFDFAPLYRSSIGFNRISNLLNSPQRLQAVDTWPPCDIIKNGADEYRIVMAVAGFGAGDLEITQERNVLVVKGTNRAESEGEYLHRGIADRGFERCFELADRVRVQNASIRNGLLTVSLHREIPEMLKPRKISIGTGSQAAVHQSEPEKQAA
jgi:molecular chaperone IbpA